MSPTTPDVIQQLNDLAPQLAQANLQAEDAQKRYSAAYAPWEKKHRALIEGRKVANRVKSDLDTKVRGLLEQAHEQGHVDDLPEYYSLTPMAAPLYDKRALLEYLIYKLPAIAVQLLTIDDAAIEKFLSDNSRVDQVTGAYQLVPALSDVPVKLGEKVKSTRIEWSKLPKPPEPEPEESADAGTPALEALKNTLVDNPPETKGTPETESTPDQVPVPAPDVTIEASESAQKPAVLGDIPF